VLNQKPDNKPSKAYVNRKKYIRRKLRIYLWAIVTPFFIKQAVKKRAMERKELEEMTNISEHISKGIPYFVDLVKDLLEEMKRKAKNMQITNSKGLFSGHIKESKKVSRLKEINF